jgi:hypothetical protein
MRTIIALALVCTVLLGAGPAQTPADEDSKHQDTKKLMELVGTTRLLQDVIDQTIEQQIAMLRRARPEVPQKFWNEFTAEAREEASPQELIRLIAPIYDQHFTHEEIRQMIAFYETPVGKKISATLPEIQQESLEVGQQWGERLGQRLSNRVNQRLNQQGHKPLARNGGYSPLPAPPSGETLPR